MSIFQSYYIFTRSPQITRVLLFIGFSFSTSYFVIQLSSSNDLWFWSTENGTFLFRLKKICLKKRNSERNKFDPNDKSVNWITHNHFLPWAFAFVLYRVSHWFRSRWKVKLIANAVSRGTLVSKWRKREEITVRVIFMKNFKNFWCTPKSFLFNVKLEKFIKYA